MYVGTVDECSLFLDVFANVICETDMTVHKILRCSFSGQFMYFESLLKQTYFLLLTEILRIMTRIYSKRLWYNIVYLDCCALLDR